MLVLTPQPEHRESLYGYLIRLGEANGYPSPTVATSYAGYSGGGRFGLSSTVHGISRVTGIPVISLESISYIHKRAESSIGYSILGHDLSDGLANRYLRPKQRAICTQCVVELGYIEGFWDLKLAIACPRHGIEAVQLCPSCQRPINWLRPSLLHCRCGASLTSPARNAVSVELQMLLSAIRARLHGEKIIASEAGFPIQELQVLSFKSLLFLVHALGNFGKGQESAAPRASAGSIVDVEKAAKALAQWPSGFHQYLAELGEHYQETRGTHVGLRKQFSPFYHSLFRHKKFGAAFEFLRTEFINFGETTWGRSIVDKKLYRANRPQEKHRFISVSEAARRLRISPVTVRKWCVSGDIPCQQLKTNSSKRFVIDSQYIAQFERKPGEILEEREAASFVGIPVSVLQVLKVSEHYAAEHLPRIMTGYHTRDLISFRERLLVMSNRVSRRKFASCEQRTLGSVLKWANWSVTTAKVNFLCAYLDGKIQAIGKTSNDPLSVFFDESQISAFLTVASQTEAVDALTLTQAGEKLGCSIDCVSEMLKLEVLRRKEATGYRTVCAESVDEFHERYIAINSLANELATTVRRLLRLCEKTGVEEFDIKVRRGYTTSFVERNVAERLISFFQNECEQREARRQSESATKRDIQAVRKYLDFLAESGEPLPRCGNKLNKAAIGKASGIHRNAMYNVPEIVRLLSEREEQDVEMFSLRAGSSFAFLEMYLDQVAKGTRKIPLRPNGKPHKSQIAQEAGIDRSIFYTNDAANRLLESHCAAHFVALDESATQRCRPAGGEAGAPRGHSDF